MLVRWSKSIELLVLGSGLDEAGIAARCIRKQAVEQRFASDAKFRGFHSGALFVVVGRRTGTGSRVKA